MDGIWRERVNQTYDFVLLDCITKEGFKDCIYLRKSFEIFERKKLASLLELQNIQFHSCECFWKWKKTGKKDPYRSVEMILSPPRRLRTSPFVTIVVLYMNLNLWRKKIDFGSNITKYFVSFKCEYS